MTLADMPSAAAGQDGAVASGKGPRAGQPKRRSFTAAYKARIVQEYGQLQTGRERGALLRREGLYSSHITDWRKSRDAGAANGLADKPAGRPMALLLRHRQHSIKRQPGAMRSPQ